MPAPTASRIDEVGIAPVRLAHRAAKAGLIARRQDQMHVVWHQTIGPNRNAILDRLLCKQIAVYVLIAGLEENRLTPIAALRHMMRSAWNDNPCITSHKDCIT